LRTKQTADAESDVSCFVNLIPKRSIQGGGIFAPRRGLRA
jgi:hypothetical protein